MPSQGQERDQDGGRRVIIVLGMHRSGTSLLGSVLDALGVDMGKVLVRPDPNNAAGYYENEEVVRLNTEIQRRLDRRWVSAKGTLPYPDGWETSDELREPRARLVQVVEQELSRTSGLLGIKDPRISTLVPLWRGILHEVRAAPVFLLSVRHPAAVAASLERRDGISSARAQLLWLLHNLDAVRESGDDLRSVVDFGLWFTRPREQAARVWAAVAEGSDDEPDAARLDLAVARVDPSLRHHRPSLQSPLPLVEETYQRLLASADSGSFPPELLAVDSQLSMARALLLAWGEVIAALPPDTRGVGRPSGPVSRSERLR